MESLDSLLCAEGSESLKSLCLKLLLCLVTVKKYQLYNLKAYMSHILRDGTVSKFEQNAAVWSLTRGKNL